MNYCKVHKISYKDKCPLHSMSAVQGHKDSFVEYVLKKQAEGL